VPSTCTGLMPHTDPMLIHLTSFYAVVVINHLQTKNDRARHRSEAHAIVFDLVSSKPPRGRGRQHRGEMTLMGNALQVGGP